MRESGCIVVGVEGFVTSFLISGRGRRHARSVRASPRLALRFESSSKTVIACWRPLVRFEERNRPVVLDTSDGIGDRSGTYHLDDVVRCRYLVFGDAKFPRWSEIWEVLVISRFVGN